MSKLIHGFLIIGSGASGSSMAYHLTQAGADSVMLEAGKQHDKTSYSSNEMRSNAGLFWGGGSDFTQDSKTILLRGKVLGGGTVVNNCLLDRFDSVALDDWADRSGIRDFHVDHLQPHYEEAEKHLNLYTYQPQDWNKNAQLYAESFDKLGLEWSPLRRGESNCGGVCDSGQGRKNDCIVCLGGCPRDSKQSMPVTYLKKALANGLQLETEFEVSGIVHSKHMVAVHGTQRGEKRVVYARKLILAAGAIGSTEILLRSGYKKTLPALGENFFCHPQFMSTGFMREEVDAHKGALQSLKSSDPRFRQQGFKLENVFAGPIAVSMLYNQYGREHHRYMKRYRHMACIEVAIRDATPGQISLTNSGRLSVRKRVSGIDELRARAGQDTVRELFAAMGAYEVMESRLQIGLHLMGGCAIGENPKQAVVAPNFQVYGHENIYLADGGIFPSAPGINPSLTIMALSHKAAQSILADMDDVSPPAATTHTLKEMSV